MSGSLRDLGKALSSALSLPISPHPLSDDLQEAIDLYIDKYSTIDDSDSQRLQDDLLILYKRHVAEDSTKHATFLAALRQLRPALKGQDRLLEWWNILVKPTLESLGKDKAVATETRGILLSVMVHEDEENANGEAAVIAKIFTKRVLDIYLEKTRPSALMDDMAAQEDEGSKFIAENIESLLVGFGRKRPQEFLSAIDELIVKRDHRAQALSLLSTFLRHQPPHLYEVLKTQLIEHLLKCLMIDTSTTVISLALTSLVMFLPHIPSSLVPYLPRLFIIYSRLLCWERYCLSPPNPEKDAEKSASVENGGIPADLTWEKLEYSFDTADSTTPELVYYFTFLYGLYPLNLMSYTRKSNKYLRDANFEGADELDLNQDLIRQRTERFRRAHLLHPNFFAMTIESELADTNRWMNSDPADIVADCMALYATITPPRVDDPGPPPTSKLPDLPASYVATEDIPSQSLLAMDDDGTTLANEDQSPTNSRYDDTWMPNSSGANGSLSRSSSKRKLSLRKRGLRSNGIRSGLPSPAARPADAEDSPTLPALPDNIQKEVLLQDMLQTQQTLRGSLHQTFPNDSSTSLHTRDTPSPRLDAYIHSLIQTKSLKSPAIRPTGSETQSSVAFLQREVVLLRNDLNFERYLKQQHLSHIGQLHRKYIKEATVEAETQNLINKTRTLSLKLDEAKRSYDMLKRETSTSKNQAKKWEGELNAKIRTLREEQKQWRTDEGSVRRDLQNARKECEQLRKLVVNTEAKELLSRQKLQSIEIDLNEVERLRLEVDRLHARLRDLEGREKDFELATHNEELAQTELEMANLKLKSRDSERERLKKAYDQRIDELEYQVESLQSAKPGQAPKAFQSMLDSALASSHARFTHLKKAHNDLYRRYRDLDMKYMDLRAARERDPRNPVANENQKYLPEEFELLSEDGSRDDGLGRQFPSASELAEQHDDFDEDNLATSPLGIGNASYPAHSSRRTSHYVSPNSSGSLGTSPTLQRSGVDLGLGLGLSGTNSLRSTGSTSAGLKNSRSAQQTKIKADSEVRVFGRGGVQNIGKKDKKSVEKDKDPRPPSTLKGFRGYM